MMDSFGVAEEVLHVSFPGYRVAIFSLITYMYWTYATYYYSYHQYLIMRFSICAIIMSHACHVIQSATCFL